MDEQFFKGEYFKQLNERLEKMEQKLDSINSKMLYIYGFAGAVAFLFSFAWTWIRDHLLRS